MAKPRGGSDNSIQVHAPALLLARRRWWCRRSPVPIRVSRILLPLLWLWCRAEGRSDLAICGGCWAEGAGSADLSIGGPRRSGADLRRVAVSPPFVLVEY